jgi:Tfp pilus assembly protein PilX
VDEPIPRTNPLSALGDERGAALVLALMVLLTLTGLVLALLAASGFEPQISRNHSHTVRTRYLAEAGLEYAYDVLATNVNAWNGYLEGASCSQGAVLGAAGSSLPGLASVHGTFTVSVRNDCGAGDAALTGVGLDAAAGACDPAAAGGAARDANCRVIVTSTGTLGGMTRAITAVVSRTLLPAINAALAFPGVQADLSFGGSRLSIDGRDTTLADRPGVPTGSAAAVYGVSVNGALPGLESQVESALARGGGAEIRGKDEAGSSANASGATTIRSDGTLTSRAILDFVAAVIPKADVAISASPGSPHAVDNLGSACATDARSDGCWGTTSSPKIVYVGGAPADAAGISLRIGGNSAGAGILIIENGAVEIGGSFRWNGVVIATGKNVGIRYLGGGDQQIYGATIVNELNAGAAAGFTSDASGNGSLLYSREALDLVQNALSRRLVTVYHWADQ